MSFMKVLLLGNGGREHAMAWKIAQSPACKQLFIAPGNAGTRLCGINVPISVTDFHSIGAYVISKKINMVVVGPENPLVKGIHDFFLSDSLLRSIPVIGPTQHAAMLEGSKDFSKTFMQRHNIPTAPYRTFTKETITDAYGFLETIKPPFVLKADGLAAGKGVLILDDVGDARREIEAMFSGKFGMAGEKVVVEHFLKGIELSVFIITDGSNYCILPEAKDYKRIGEGDAGMNTGGMGSVSGVPFADKKFMNKVEERIIKPTVSGLAHEKIGYKGFLFFGLIKVGDDPYVIEYNARLGDPETESVLPRIKNDIIGLFEGVATGRIGDMQIETDPRFVATVMMVSGGYPAEYKKGNHIFGLENIDSSLVFHAGTRFDEKRKEILTDGGRVLAITSFGETIKEALDLSYRSISKINFNDAYYRMDIGFDL